MNHATAKIVDSLAAPLSQRIALCPVTFRWACARLEEGALGVEQRRSVQRVLRTMETAGLVVFRDIQVCAPGQRQGWYLTEFGRAAAQETSR